MAKHRATENPNDLGPVLSPVSGSLFITVAEARYPTATTSVFNEWRPILFPSMNEEEAQRMADYLDSYVAPEGTGFAPEYRNIRVAHCQFTEIPEYNDTDPLS